MLAPPSTGCAQSNTDAAESQPVATVNGSPVTDADLRLGAKLIQIEQQAYQLRLEALEGVIQQRLLEAEAVKRGITVDELLHKEVLSRVADPTPEEVGRFYNERKARIRQPLEEIREPLAQAMRSAREQELRQKFVDGLREASDVRVLLKAPRMPVEIGDAPRRGPAGAPVTIIEFSDYQCPYCKRAQPTLQEVQEKYGDQVSFVYKDLPLKQIHPQAQRAAEAAHCAGDQGRYWEYHDALFDLPSITDGAFPEIASNLGLDPIPFQQCLDAGKYAARVDADLNQAIELGADSTPSFFVNGILLRGSQPLPAFVQVIDAEIKAAQRAKD
jgi:predicted DsbA family dithiol-disulfide isomerase